MGLLLNSKNLEPGPGNVYITKPGAEQRERV